MKISRSSDKNAERILLHDFIIIDGEVPIFFSIQVNIYKFYWYNLDYSFIGLFACHNGLE